MNVFIIAAITADGFIARSGTHGADWTGNEDKKVFVRLTKEAGTIVMGSRTFATIGHALPGRRNIVYTSNPELITADGVETTSENPSALIERLEVEGIKSVAICGGAQIYDMFLRAGVVTEIYLTVISKLFGQGIPLFSSSIDQNLELMSTDTLDKGAVLLHFKIV